jgi:peptidoglycan hydrolase-like protein with peptidoglycan-binding domain
LRRSLIVGATLVALVAAGGIVETLPGSAPHASRSIRGSAPGATVERRDLIATQDVNGTLAYAHRQTVSSPGSGSLTGIAPVGTMARPGQVLFSVAGKPLVALAGAAPLTRVLSEGVPDGRDILDLERNIVQLGFDPRHLIVVDRHFAASTRSAVEAFQRRYAMPPTGSVDSSQIVFLPRRVYVTEELLTNGSALAFGNPVLEVASDQVVAELSLSASDRTLARMGAQTSLTLPDGSAVAAKISSVGTTASNGANGQSGGASSNADSAITATATPATRVDFPEGTPLTAHLSTAVRRAVLAVPVTAILATSATGRAIEVFAPHGGTRLIPVRTGLYAGGFVEVTSGALRTGMRVVIASS